MMEDLIKIDKETEALSCPVCGEYYTHLENVSMNFNSMDGNSRQIAVLGFSCEHGHSFDVVVNQHKGLTFMHYANETEHPTQ